MKSALVLATLALLGAGQITIPLVPVHTRPGASSALPVSSDSLRALFVNSSKALENRSNVRCMQMQYRGSIYVGTPPKRFALIFDTGSSWLWVTNSTCAHSCHSAENSYESRNSTSYFSKGYRVTLEYGMGTAVGYVATETVGPSPQAVVINQTFATIYRNSGFSGMHADGILGLGFNSLSDRNPTLVENLYAQGYIDTPLFSIYLSDNDFGDRLTEAQTSVITFGFWDLTKYAKSDVLVYLPVYSNTGYWAVPLKSVHLGGNKVAGTSFIAILDSGTSLLIGPAAEVLAIMDYFVQRWTCALRDGLLECDCPDLSQLPDLHFVLGNAGYVFVIKPSMYALDRNHTCQLLLSSMQDSGLWILGDVFLRAYYTVFDMENSRVGLAPSINNDSGVTSYQPPTEVYLLIVAVLFVMAMIVLIVLAFLGFSKCCGAEETASPMQQRLITS